MEEITGLVETVYRDADLRKEFQKFVDLRRAYRPIVDQVGQKVRTHQPASVSYSHITTAIYQEQFELSKELRKVKGLPEGMIFLSQSLVRTIAQRYALSIPQASEVARLVADQYEQAGVSG